MLVAFFLDCVVRTKELPVPYQLSVDSMHRVNNPTPQSEKGWRNAFISSKSKVCLVKHCFLNLAGFSNF